MNIFKFYVIVPNNIVEQGRLPLPSVEKSSDRRVYLGGQGWADFAGHHSLSFGRFLLFHCKRPHYFKGIPLAFIRQNWSWFHCCHEKCYVVVDGERSGKSRISWNFREGRWEGALCSGGWRFSLNKLNPSEGDVVEFKLMFDLGDNVHHFNVRVSGTRSRNGRGRFEAGSSSRS
ncbi:hypothetical protein ACFE04_021134 [Oxalis oulophora]